MSAAIAAPLRVGVVGLGMGRYHIEQYRKCTNCQVVALCDLSGDRLKISGAAIGVPHTFTDADKLFASGLVDVVSIATPNYLHCPQTLAALEAGLHVLCEKPLALNGQEAAKMVEAARKRNLKLGVHFNHRMAAPVQAMAGYTYGGDLGDIYFVRSTWHRRRGIPSGAESWFYQKRLSGGGCLIDLGVHILDIALYLAKFPRVVSVTGQTQQRFAKTDVPGQLMDVEDFASAYLRCDGGAAIALEVSWASHHEHPEQMITAVYGSAGSVVRRMENYQPVEVHVSRREHGNLVTTHLDTIESAATVSVQQDFINAVLEDRPPACSGEHGLVAMRILDALYKSSQTGREVRLR